MVKNNKYLYKENFFNLNKDNYYLDDLDDDLDYSWDLFGDPEVFKNKENIKHIFKTSNHDLIKIKLKNISRNKNCRFFFEDILAGEFLISVVSEQLINDCFYIDNLFDYAKNNKLIVQIYSFQNTYLWVDAQSDHRFKMTKWCKKKELTFDELIQIISHCVKLSKVQSFL